MEKVFTGKEGVYRWSQYFGRGGSLSGVFVARADEVESVIGRDVYWGEVLGKHSEVEGELEASDFELLTDDADFIEKFRRFGLATGRNPIQRIAEWDEENGE
jgi:hypothetical protein